LAALKRWQWTGRRERAAGLVAEDQLSDAEIASQLGITREGLRKWRRQPEFQERVRDVQQQIRAAIVARGIVERQNRVDALNRRWQLMRDVIEARASDMQGVPGGETGLLLRTYKRVGRDDYQEEYAVDVGLLRELRAHEEQAAKELGQWTEKRELTGKDGGPILITTVEVVKPPDHGQ
jgi:hypothetical protein